jgi:hypothetical protein
MLALVKASMRDEVARVLEQLVASSREGATVSIDDIGEAIGAMVITAEEIDALFTALERAKRKIGAPSGARGEASLKKVVAAARAIREERGAEGAKPTTKEIAKRAGLPERDVTFALALLRVMQR